MWLLLNVTVHMHKIYALVFLIVNHTIYQKINFTHGPYKNLSPNYFKIKL